VIARRLSEAKQSIPHYYLTVDIHMDKILQCVGPPLRPALSGVCCVLT
jgi:hypothetical protein